MRIVRGKRPESGFTILDNALLRDARISERARGLLVRILSYPDDWQTDSTTLAEECREGRDAIRRAMRELEAAGYMRRKRRRVDRGRFVSETFVYDRPVPADSDRESHGTSGRTTESAAGGTEPPGGGGDLLANPEAPATDLLRPDASAEQDDPWSWAKSANVQVGPETGFQSSENQASVNQSSEDQSSGTQAVNTEDCYEEALGRARGAADAARDEEDQERQPAEGWRQKDRRVFEELIGAPCVKVVKHSPRWAPGHFNTATIYKVLSKPIPGDERQPMRYPGSVLQFKADTDQLEDWLWETGIEPCTDGHAQRRGRSA